MLWDQTVQKFPNPKPSGKIDCWMASKKKKKTWSSDGLSCPKKWRRRKSCKSHKAYAHKWNLTSQNVSTAYPTQFMIRLDLETSRQLHLCGDVQMRLFLGPASNSILLTSYFQDGQHNKNSFSTLKVFWNFDMKSLLYSETPFDSETGWHGDTTLACLVWHMGETGHLEFTNQLPGRHSPLATWDSGSILHLKLHFGISNDMGSVNMIVWSFFVDYSLPRKKAAKLWRCYKLISW